MLRRSWIIFVENAMIFDTDVLIFVQRGNHKAARLIDSSMERAVSVQTLMELLQGARNREEQRIIQRFLNRFGFEILPLTENIGHRATVYVEEYSLATGIRAGDAIIAATATENGLPLSTANGKHFKNIKNLQLKLFKP